jgi:cell division control protein 6
VNCRRRNSEGAVLLHVIRKFDPGFPDRGFSVAEMLTIVQKHLQMKAVNLILILDEANFLLERGKVDLIYQLTRFNEEGGSNWNVSLILISQVDVWKWIDQASQSTFKRTHVVDFKKYTADELADILRQRVELALHPGTITDEVVKEIASIAARKYGDARFAIDLLASAAGLANTRKSDTVTVEHVRNANAQTYATVEREKVVDLSRQQKLVLLAAARALKRRERVPSGDLYKTYTVVCEEYSEAVRKSTQFWKYLNELESRGLIELETSKDGVAHQSVVSLQEVEAEYLVGFIEEALAAEGKGQGDEAGWPMGGE